MSELVFDLVLALFIAHELDAMQRHEWRIFPILRNLPDAVAHLLFTLVHVPLLVVFFWLMNNALAQQWFRPALSAFAMVHVWLHWLMRHHPRYELNNRLSWGLIVATGLAGALHLGTLAATTFIAL